MVKLPLAFFELAPVRAAWRFLSKNWWTTTVDPVFGELHHNGTFYSGSVLFVPTQQRLHFSIHLSRNLARRSGPPRSRITDRHRTLFRELENRFAALARQVADFIVFRYPFYTENFTTDQVWHEFALERLEIFDTQKEPLLLVLCFKSLRERLNLFFTVRNWEVRPEWGH